jgi:Fe-S-cluster containining protein
VYAARPMICRQFPLTMCGGHGGLLSYSYCSFVKNLLVHKSKGLILRNLFVAKHAEESTEYLKETSKETGGDFSRQFSFADALSDLDKFFSNQAKTEKTKDQGSKKY